MPIPKSILTVPLKRHILIKSVKVTQRESTKQRRQKSDIEKKKKKKERAPQKTLNPKPKPKLRALVDKVKIR